LAKYPPYPKEKYITKRKRIPILFIEMKAEHQLPIVSYNVFLKPANY
jgi:hypothetical protein